MTPLKLSLYQLLLLAFIFLLKLFSAKLQK